MKPKITDLTLDELNEVIRSHGEPDYRARQIFKWLFEILDGYFVVLC